VREGRKEKRRKRREGKEEEKGKNGKICKPENFWKIFYEVDQKLVLYKKVICLIINKYIRAYL
jgi:hypothetical protein